MEKITTTELLKQIKKSLVDLWLLDELKNVPYLPTHDSSQMLIDFHQKSIKLLEEVNDEDSVQSILIKLLEIQVDDPYHAQNTIKIILEDFQKGSSIISDKEKLDALDALLSPIIKTIRESINFDQALPHMKFIERVCGTAARISFSGYEYMSENMEKVLRDFEHSDEEEVMKEVFLDIQEGTYLPSEIQNSSSQSK